MTAKVSVVEASILEGAVGPSQDQPRAPAPRRRPGLLGRETECQVLDELIGAVRGGESRTLVLRGEAGVGKTALLDYLVTTATGCRLLRATSVQSEIELTYAAVHQLCAPLLRLADDLPRPMREALVTAFGLQAGPPPDRFLVGLAVLGLLTMSADDRPLLCVIDDAQWLDRASLQVLTFVARRLFVEPIACVFAVRSPDDETEFSGLPVLEVTGLPAPAARAVLHSAFPGPLDEQIRDRIIAEAQGNPLALLELPAEISHAELAGGFGWPAGRTVPGRVEDGFRRRLDLLPPGLRQLLVLAAADPVGDPRLVWRAAAHLGSTVDAVSAAAVRDLVRFGARTRFRHPLVRSAAYRAASAEELRTVHRALAEVTDDPADVDRRAWHRAHATEGYDEEVAAELERAARRAQDRGGLAAAAAFLERAAVLTEDAERRAQRTLAAAAAKHEAGAPDAALGLLAGALSGPLDERQRARATLLSADIQFTMNRDSHATRMLLDAARQATPLDSALARESFLQAVSAVMFAGRLSEGPGLAEVASIARAAPPASSEPRAADLLLDAFVAHLTDDAGADETMRKALRIFVGDELPIEENLRWLWLAFIVAVALWDDAACRTLAERHVRLARTSGALAALPLALSSRITMHVMDGELAEAESLSEEVDTIVAATGLTVTNYGALMVASCLGREAIFDRLGHDTARLASSRGEGVGLTVGDWTRAVLLNGLGRYDEAKRYAARASADPPAPGSVLWATAELVEAAVRAGDHESARRALARLTAATDGATTDWAGGISARCRALVAPGPEAGPLYLTAIDRLRRTRLRLDLARAYLLHGEWLRRERRRIEAREQLRTAHALFTEMGTEAFATRAARELRATGATAPRRRAGPGTELTAREAQIAKLAGDGLSNGEIAVRLFVSPRTVEYHLHKIFAKTGITSRHALATGLLPDAASG
jgi:DNA-binding CsgD family transcriptional regulator